MSFFLRLSSFFQVFCGFLWYSKFFWNDCLLFGLRLWYLVAVSEFLFVLFGRWCCLGWRSLVFNPLIFVSFFWSRLLYIGFFGAWNLRLSYGFLGLSYVSMVERFFPVVFFLWFFHGFSRPCDAFSAVHPWALVSKIRKSSHLWAVSRLESHLESWILIRKFQKKRQKTMRLGVFMF